MSNFKEELNLKTNKLLKGPAEKDRGMYISVTDYPIAYEIDPETLGVKKELTLDLMQGIYCIQYSLLKKINAIKK